MHSGEYRLAGSDTRETHVKPSVCLFTDSREPSGLGEHMLTLAIELQAAYDLSFACPATSHGRPLLDRATQMGLDRKSTRLNSSHVAISYAVFCLQKKRTNLKIIIFIKKKKKPKKK